MKEQFIYMNDVPVEVIEAILSHMDGLFLVHKARLVCKQWRDVIQRSSLWRQVCIRSHLGDPACYHGVTDFKMFYFKLSQNLLRNGWASDKLKHWKCKYGHDFLIETCYPKAVGCKPLELPNGEYILT